MTSISVITPTIGRASLKTMLEALLPQLADGDEALVIGDGPQPKARNIVEAFRNDQIRYWESEPLFNWGNPQRNSAIDQARGEWLVFIDDDDVPLPECAARVRRGAQDHGKRPLMFKMTHLGGLLWRSRNIELGNVSGQMFVVPNVKGRVGRWSAQYAADFDFIRSTLALYPEGESIVAWMEDQITLQGYVGPHRKKAEENGNT